MEVHGKIAIVTGASSGIGLATAKLLTKKGAKVALVARNKETLEQLAKELKESFVCVADMSDVAQVRAMVKTVYSHFGSIDIVVNNAGRGYDAPVESIDPKKFTEIFNLDLLGPVIVMQEVIPIMKKQKKGAIVNISSGTALMFLPNMSPYSSMKRALVGVSLTAREEVKEYGITVSVVYPYITDTNFEQNTVKDNVPEWEDSGETNLPKADSPEYVAEKILEAIQSGKPEIFAHAWMGK